MPCYHPISAWQLLNVPTVNGKPSISFKNPHATPSPTRVPIQLPCGQCIGCRLERSRQWAVRCCHESSLYDDNCFITLTYSDENLPPNGSLVKSHFQKFMKRLRKFISAYVFDESIGEYIPRDVSQPEDSSEDRSTSPRVRYFQCGEYGELLSRPHYHACLFNFDFQDKVLWNVRDGVKLYRSPTLEKLWQYGYSSIGDVTFESAAYVARYITKKINGGMANDHYGEKIPEYITMSRRPGLARDWFDRFNSDVYPTDVVVVRKDIKCKPPRYYDKIYDEINPDEFEKIREKRIDFAKNNPDNSKSRLAVRETVKLAKAKKLKRSFEYGP